MLEIIDGVASFASSIEQEASQWNEATLLKLQEQNLAFMFMVLPEYIPIGRRRSRFMAAVLHLARLCGQTVESFFDKVVARITFQDAVQMAEFARLESEAHGALAGSVVVAQELMRWLTKCYQQEMLFFRTIFSSRIGKRRSPIEVVTRDPRTQEIIKEQRYADEVVSDYLGRALRRIPVLFTDRDLPVPVCFEAPPVVAAPSSSSSSSRTCGGSSGAKPEDLQEVATALESLVGVAKNSNQPVVKKLASKLLSTLDLTSVGGSNISAAWRQLLNSHFDSHSFLRSFTALPVHRGKPKRNLTMTKADFKETGHLRTSDWSENMYDIFRHRGCPMRRLHETPISNAEDEPEEEEESEEDHHPRKRQKYGTGKPKLGQVLKRPWTSTSTIPCEGHNVVEKRPRQLSALSPFGRGDSDDDNDDDDDDKETEEDEEGEKEEEEEEEEAETEDERGTANGRPSRGTFAI